LIKLFLPCNFVTCLVFVRRIGVGLTPVEEKNPPPSYVSKNENPSTMKEQQLNELLQKTIDIPLETQLQYCRNGHAALKSLIPDKILDRIKFDLIRYASNNELKAWQQKVATISSQEQNCTTIKQCKDMLQKDPIPFLQYFNTWKHLHSVRELVTSSFMGSIASTFLNVPKVKLYQDSLFYKRHSIDKVTPWHLDAPMTPFDTSNLITFWIPLNYIDAGGTRLYFVNKSHSDFALPFWNGQPSSDSAEFNRLDLRYGGDNVQHYMPMNLGDCTVHSGWTLHMAGDGSGNNSQDDRYALSITYVDAHAEIRENVSTKTKMGYNEDYWSYQAWINDIQPREYFEHDMIPIVWPPNK